MDSPEPSQPTYMSATGVAGTMIAHLQHANDRFQFPDVITNAIKAKHGKQYADMRTLVVVFDGDYSTESDEVIESWIDEIRKRMSKGNSLEILLVERDRRKVFKAF